MIEYLTAGFLTAASVILLFLGIQMVTFKNINLARFIPGQGVIQAEMPKERRKLTIPAKRTVLLAIMGIVSSWVIAYIITGNELMAFLFSLTGFVVPRAWENWQRDGQQKILAAQMEQAAEIMAAVLRSGSGISAALERAAKEAGDPLKSELIQTAAEIRVGVTNAVAFERLAERLGLAEMQMFSMAVNLQQTGMAVNLPAVLEQVQSNIRSDQGYSEEISAITAENRMAGWVVACVPFGTIAVMRLMAPDFVAPLFNTLTGSVIFILCTLAIIAGLVWIMRMATAG